MVRPSEVLVFVVLICSRASPCAWKKLGLRVSGIDFRGDSIGFGDLGSLLLSIAEKFVVLDLEFVLFFYYSQFSL